MRAAIVGGGIAGSASAIALRRIGAEVVVYEANGDRAGERRGAAAGPVGSFISVAANGLRALDTLGCLDAVQRAGFPVARQRMWSGRGKLLGDVARGRRATDPLHSVTLLRADLVGILRAEAVRLGATVVTGRRIEDAREIEREANCRERPASSASAIPIEDAREADPKADIVVGADGIWSRTRRLLNPAGPEPAYAGIYTVSGVSAPADGLPLDGFNWIFARHGVFLYLPTPDGSIWWSAQIAAREEPADPGATDLGATFSTEPAARAILARATQRWSATVMHVLPLVQRRHDGRIVLIGDAAHPAGAGQGASMALEDAVVLAQELAAEPDGALARFDRIRLGRAGKLAKMESTNRDAKVAGPLASRVREAVMPFVFGRFYEKATGWLYDYDVGALPAPQGGTQPARQRNR